MTGAMVKLYKARKTTEAFRWQGQPLDGIRIGESVAIEPDGALVVTCVNASIVRIAPGHWVVDDSPDFSRSFQNVFALADDAFRQQWAAV